MFIGLRLFEIAVFLFYLYFGATTTPTIATNYNHEPTTRKPSHNHHHHLRHFPHLRTLSSKDHAATISAVKTIQERTQDGQNESSCGACTDFSRLNLPPVSPA